MAPPQGNVFKQVISRDWPRNHMYHHDLLDYSALQEIGFYDPRFPMYQTWDLKIRFSHRFRGAYCDKPLLEYRKHAGGISSLPRSRHVEAMRSIYEKNRHLLLDLPDADRRDVEDRLESLWSDSGAGH